MSEPRKNKIRLIILVLVVVLVFIIFQSIKPLEKKQNTVPNRQPLSSKDTASSIHSSLKELQAQDYKKMLDQGEKMLTIDVVPQENIKKGISKEQHKSTCGYCVLHAGRKP